MLLAKIEKEVNRKWTRQTPGLAKLQRPSSGMPVKTPPLLSMNARASQRFHDDPYSATSAHFVARFGADAH